MDTDSNVQIPRVAPSATLTRLNFCERMIHFITGMEIWPIFSRPIPLIIPNWDDSPESIASSESPTQHSRDHHFRNFVPCEKADRGRENHPHVS